ncbi:ABC transporter ATP-binding protein [Vallitalea guaymasensis]|uniref:ABC transporter ATP-binding protein n=1 Tax=Vallitalea guaymasensis TaxID=1185412 RepID=UPI002729938B|nr:ABC transporter ATP-binding protein [Vallitalea guaymasensis]
MNKKKKGLSHLFEYTGKYKVLTILSCILSGISAILSLVPFICIWLVVKELFNNIPDIHKTQGLSFYGWLAVYSALLSILIYFVSMMLAHIAAFRTAKNMKRKALTHLMKLPLGYFSQTTSGGLRKIIDDNAGLTETFLAHQLPDLSGALLMPIAILILLFAFNWKLGILCLIPLLVGFLFIKHLMSGKNAKFMSKYMGALEDMNGEAVEYIRGIPVVKTFGQTIYSFKSFHSSIMKYKEFATTYAINCRIPMAGFTVSINGAFILLIPVGILLIAGANDYNMFLLDLIFYILFTPICTAMISKIMYASDNIMITKEAVKRIDSILEQQPLVETKTPQVPVNPNIKFNNVSFSYPNSDKKALCGISFNLPQGNTVALVGPSGGGKSTIAALVPRFFDVQSGSIKIDGIDVRNISTKELMSQVAFVFQDTHLFKSSILDNIKIAKPSASREQVINAINAAQCNDIIDKMPNGLDTVIGEKGVYLSGGEMQRIALARAILKDAKIVILDEATAFADPENEYKIQIAFEKLTKGKTVLMIAHRLSTVKNADCILVIDKGRVKEKGTHDELIKKNNVYAHMWKDYQTSITWKVGKEANHA